MRKYIGNGFKKCVKSCKKCMRTYKNCSCDVGIVVVVVFGACCYCSAYHCYTTAAASLRSHMAPGAHRSAPSVEPGAIEVVEGRLIF